MFSTALLLASLTVGAWAACQYEIKNLKIDICDGKPIKEWTLKGVTAELNDDCNILIKGCFLLNEELTEITVDYTASKNGMEIAKGSQKVCDMELFDAKFNCPMAKNTKICTTKNWVKEIPKGMINMAVGNIKGQAKVKTNIGEKCYKLSADIKRK